MTTEGTVPDDETQARRALAAAAAAALAAILVLPPLLDFHVDLASFEALLKLIAIPVLFLPYVYWRRLDAMRAPLEATALGLILTLPAIVFSFSAMRLGLPIADEVLLRADRALGFDWPSLLRLIDGAPTIARLAGIGYDSLSLQLLFLPTLLCLAGLAGRAYRFVLCYVILVAIASLIGAFFPSEGAYVAFGVDPATLRHVDGKFGHFFLEVFHAVRAEPDFRLSFDNVAGIVTFPSVHAGGALLCAWAAWPSRILRAPILALNLLMTVGTPFFGAHYLIDVLAGWAVAWLAIHLSGRLIAAVGRADRASPDPGLTAATAG